MRKLFSLISTDKAKALIEIGLILIIVMVLIPAMWVLAFVGLATVSISALKWSINFLSQYN